MAVSTPSQIIGFDRLGRLVQKAVQFFSLLAPQWLEQKIGDRAPAAGIDPQPQAREPIRP